jgi:hypothetical protein
MPPPFGFVGRRSAGPATPLRGHLSLASRCIPVDIGTCASPTMTQPTAFASQSAPHVVLLHYLYSILPPAPPPCGTTAHQSAALVFCSRAPRFVSHFALRGVRAYMHMPECCCPTWVAVLHTPRPWSSVVFPAALAGPHNDATPLAIHSLFHSRRPSWSSCSCPRKSSSRRSLLCPPAPLATSASFRSRPISASTVAFAL